MRRRFLSLLTAAGILALMLVGAAARAETPDPWSDPLSYAQDQVRRSIAGYDGECPCPYSKDKSGQLCGSKSAYLRPMPAHGFTPFCYVTDVLPSLPAAPPQPKPADTHKPKTLQGQSV